LVYTTTELIDDLICCSSKEVQLELKVRYTNLQRGVIRQAKCKWQLNFTKKCKREQFKNDLTAAWDIGFKITECFQAHHKDYKPESFLNSKGKISSSPKEKADAQKTHFMEYIQPQSKHRSV